MLRARRIALIFPLIAGCLYSCTSEAIKVGDGEIEKPLQDVAGVRREDLASAQSKLDAQGPGSPGLTLPDLYALAVDRTERLAIKQEKVIQAESDRNRAVGSWIPSLSFRETRLGTLPDHKDEDRERRQRNQLAAIALNNPALATTTTSSSLPPNLSTGRRLVLHVPIFTGLKEYAGIEGSRALIDQRKYELLHDAGRLYLELAQDFYNVLVLERSLKTRTELLSLSRQNVDQLDRFVALGRVKRTEALQARSTVARLEADVQAVQDNLTRSREALSLSSGVRPDALFADAEPMPAPSLSRLQAEDIAESRADVMAARATLEVSKASLTQAQGEFAPSFYVDGYYNLPRHNVPRNRDIIAQFTFEFPIFSGGSSIAGITKAESEKRTAQLTYDLLKRQALLEIRQAFDAWESSRLQIAAYKKALDAAELNYGAQLDYYNRRLGTIVDLLAALTTLASARDDYQKALLQERLNRVWVGVATGELPVRRKNQETGTDKGHSKEAAK